MYMAEQMESGRKAAYCMSPVIRHFENKVNLQWQRCQVPGLVVRKRGSDKQDQESWRGMKLLQGVRVYVISLVAMHSTLTKAAWGMKDCFGLEVKDILHNGEEVLVART